MQHLTPRLPAPARLVFGYRVPTSSFHPRLSSLHAARVAAGAHRRLRERPLPVLAAAAAPPVAAPSSGGGSTSSGSSSSSSSSEAWAASIAAAAKPDPGQAWRLALRVLAPDWLLAAGTALTLIVSIANTLAFPLAIGQLFDVVKQHGAGAAAAAAAAAGGGTAAAAGPALPPLLSLVPGGAPAAPATFKAALLGLTVCMVLGPISSALVAYLAPLLAERFGTRLRKHLFEEVLDKDQAFFDHTSKGDLVSRLTLDVATLQACLADLIGQRGLRSLLEVLGPMLIIGFKHPIMAVITCAVTPLLSKALRGVVVKSTDLSYQRQEVAAAALEFASDRLSHVQTVQVFGQEEREASAFRGLAAQGYRVAGKYALYQGLVEGAGRLAVNVGTVSLLGFGGMLVLQSKMSVGTLLSYMVFNLFISLGLSQLAASLGDVGKAIGALERISTVIGDPAEPAEPAVDQAAAAAGGAEAGGAVASRTAPPTAGSNGSHTPAATNGAAAAASSSNGAHHAAAGADAAAAAAGASSDDSAAALGLRDVWFRYQGREDFALKGMSLTVPPGTTLALVGPSGGGKSTVASLLLGLYTPERGEVVVGGEAMRSKADWEAARQHMAAVLQQPMLMSGSVAQQIAYARPEATMEQIVAAAKQANADEFIRELPQGYDTQIGERGHALSGGQKQRLAIARALLCRPQILVLDEVTSALDVESEVAIDAALAQLQGCTKLVIAHRLSTVRSADQIVVVVGGQVVEQGTHEELMRVEGGAYQRLVLAAEL